MDKLDILMLERTEHMKKKGYMTPEELAERWGVTIGYLANMRYKKKGVPFVKRFGRVYYAIIEVEKKEQIEDYDFGN